MITLTYVYVEYETSISSWDIWNDNLTKKIVLPLTLRAAQLNSQNSYEIDIHNEI